MSPADAPALDVATPAAAEVLGAPQDARAETRAGGQEARADADAGRAARDVGRLEAELAQARQAAAAIAGPPGSGNVSITRDGQGNVVIQTPEGRTITLGEGIVPPGAIEGIVASLAPAPPAPPFPVDRGPPEGVLVFVAMLCATLVAIVVGLPVARAFARRTDARATGSGVSGDVAVRLERIEQAVDTVAVEVERISEAQRYAARLLTERLPERVPQLGGARVPAAPPDDAARA